MNAPPGIHPADETLIAFGLGKADETTSSAVARHLEVCSECRSRVASLSADSFVDRLQTAKGPGKTSLPNKPLPTLDRNITTRHSHSLLPRELADCEQYQDIRELGKGGMGVVYVARNKLMGREEVLKVVNKSMLERPGAVERFLREIQSAAKLQHPNVVAAYSAMQLGELLVFAMEYVPGQDLAQVVRSANRSVPIQNACYYAYQTALGLQHAYEKGMVHRDIKPSNLILAKDGKKSLVKILDFGLAKVSSEKGFDTGLTGEGKMLGTPDFMSPEQALDAAKADIRADIYSLGCTLYYLLVGRPPFAANSLLELLQHHQGKSATPINLLRPDVPADLDMVVAQMMAKDPRKRYQMPAEVAKVLLPFVKPGTAAKPGAKPDKSANAGPEVSLGEWKSATPGSAASQLVVEAKRPEIELEVVSAPGVHSAPPVSNQSSVNTWEKMAEVIKSAPAGRGRRSPIGNLGAAGVVLVLLTVLLAALILRVESPNGTLVVEINDPAVEARIKNGQLILTDPDGKIRYTLAPGEHDKKIDTGPYKIRVEGADGLVLDTPEFTLKKGDKVIVKVTMEQKAVAKNNPLAKPVATKQVELSKQYLFDLKEFDCLVNDERFKDAIGGVVVKGERFNKGLWMHPPPGRGSTVKYQLDGLNAIILEGKVAINDSAGGQGSECPLTFQVLCDDKLLWKSRPMQAKQETESFKLEVEGVHVLELRVNSEQHHGNAHAVWLNPCLLTYKNKTSPEKVDLAKGKKEIPAIVPADALRRENIPAAVLASLGGGDPKRAPPELVAVLGDGRFRIPFESFSNSVFSPDGSLLAVPSSREVFLFDAKSGQLLRRLQGKVVQVWSAAFSPDGRVLAIGDEEVIRLYNPLSGVLLKELSGHGRGWLTGLVFTQDSQNLFSSSRDKTVRMWEIATGLQSRLLECSAEVSSLAITPDGQLIVAGTVDGRIYGWSPGTLGEKFVIAVGNQTWTSVSVSADGQWLATGSHRTPILKVWKIADLVNKDKPPSPFFEKQTHAGWLQFEKKSNKLWAGEFSDRVADNRIINCWDPTSAQLVSTITIQNSNYPFIRYGLSEDAQTLTAVSGWDNVVQIYDTRTGKPQILAAGHTSLVNSVAFSPDCQWLASGSGDKTVRIWYLATGKEFHNLVGHSGQVWSVAFSPDCKLLASGSHDGTIVLWDVGTGARLFTMKGHFGDSVVRFSPDGKLVAAGRGDGGAQTWYTRNGEEAQTIRGLHDGRVRCLCFSPDGLRLATGGDDGKLVITELATGKVLQSFKRNSQVRSVDFAAEGETVAVGYAEQDPTVRLWNLKDKDFISLKGHTDRIDSTSMRFDGRLAVTAAKDGSVRLWEIGGNLSRKMVLATSSVGEKLWTGALSPDGRYVATGNSNGTIYLFRLNAPQEDIHDWMASRALPAPGLSHEKWLAQVKGLYVGNTSEAVIERLRELNPGFDRYVSSVFEGGVVRGLHFPSVNVKDISPVQALPELRLLSCSDGSIADLSPLKDLKLTGLQTAHTSVSDLTPLKGMKLEWLYCDNTPVSDLKPLKNMMLTDLVISGTRVSDLTPLQEMKLTRFFCNVTGVSTLTPLQGMPLKILDCSRTQVKSLAPLKGMPLDYLNCSDTPVSDLIPLKGMPLKTLHCRGSRVSDLSPLKEMQLNELDCYLAQVDDTGLAGIEAMISLTRLEAGGPKLTDGGLEHLKKLTNLEVLTLGDSRLTGTGLVHLKGLTRLRVLDLNRIGIRENALVHLKDLQELRELRLENARVTDAGLEHLANLKNLESLWLGEQQ